MRIARVGVVVAGCLMLWLSTPASSPLDAGASEVSTGPISILNGGCCAEGCGAESGGSLVSCAEDEPYTGCSCGCEGRKTSTGTKFTTLQYPCAKDKAPYDCHSKCTTVWNCDCCCGTPGCGTATLVVEGDHTCHRLTVCTVHP